MRSEQNPRGRNIAIDANALDPKSADEETLVGRFVDLHEAGLLQQITPYGVMRELSHRNTPGVVLARSIAGIFSYPVTLTASELQRRERFRAALRGNALSDKHRADADHVFDADRNGANYFITNERRILKAAREGALQPLLGPHLHIVTLSEFLDIWDRFNSTAYQTPTPPAARD